MSTTLDNRDANAPMVGLSMIESLRNIAINGRQIEIIAIPDHHPLMQKAFRLWYDVYIEELKYPLTEGVNQDNKTLSLPPNGSIVFMAMDGEECVGTIRTTHEKYYPFEFDYHTHLSDKLLIEVSKMIVTKTLRRTGLNAYLMDETQRYNGIRYNDYYIVMNTAAKMVPFYNTMFFFKISGERIIHPIIKNESYLMACSKSNFDKVCSDLVRITEGDNLIRLKWAIKYWWYKNFNK